MAGNRSAVPETFTIEPELRALGDRITVDTQSAKKNYAEALSRSLATTFANALRSDFPGVLPESDGRGQESRARTAKGVKKLDVNYSTVELGLGLGVSIKTINFPDAKSGRYTKNYTRADGELRAEASDYHVRQPYSVLVAVIFLPAEACDDGTRDPSSFGQAVRVFRFRGGRVEPTDDPNLFEGVYIGLYETASDRFGEVGFFDVRAAPPKKGRPAKLLTFSELIREIKATYDARNSPEFIWADAPPETITEPLTDPDEEEGEGDT